MAGLIGAQSLLVVPVVMTPSFSSTTLNCVAEVNTMAHLPAIAPRLVTTCG
ncbi:hypothetical protein D3C75_1172020 [compost metagenome]